MDRSDRRLMPRAVRLAVVASLAGMSLAAGTGTLAACTGPLTSFRQALPTAQRVVIGDVERVADGGLVPGTTDGRSSWFTLRVLHTPRGERATIIDFRELQSWECGPLIAARSGDRIALAIGATDLDPPMVVNTMAWVEGTPPDGMGAETISIKEVFRLLGLGAPSTSTEQLVDRGPAGRPLSPAIVLLVIGLVALSIGWTRYGPRTPRLGRNGRLRGP